MAADNGWPEMKRLIMRELEVHDRKLDKIDERLRNIESDISALKVKGGLWGAVAGLVAGAGSYWGNKLIPVLFLAMFLGCAEDADGIDIEIVKDLKYLAEFRTQDFDDMELAGVIIAESSLRRQDCGEEFKRLTLRHPDEVEWKMITLVYPEPWPLPGIVALTECNTLRISMDKSMLFALGAISFASTLIHEMAHIAQCPRRMAGDLTAKKDEELAERIEGICLFGDPDGAGIMRPSHLYELSDK